MRFAELHSAHNDNRVVWVNPMNVVSVTKIGDSTVVATNAPSQNGHFTIYVSEDVDEAAGMLMSALTHSR